MPSADLFAITVRVADYAPVKAIIDAADEVCEAEGSSPWSLTQAIDTLRETLDALGDADADDPIL